VEVDREYVRYYPNGETACHIVGYIGKISESQQDEYLEKGYSTTDLIGKEGIEKYYESELKGTAGQKQIQVDHLGQQVSEISSEEAVPGHDVYLTIDLELQKTAEEALEEALEQISIGGTFHSKYGNYNYSKTYSNANVGSVVAVDVKTGEVLALANNPGYDPNLFARGISTEDWNSLQGDNPRDPLSPLPLYNVATMASMQPGSTFKPVTALAGLNAGFNANTKLYDNGAISMGGRTFGCWIYNQSKGHHGYLDIRHALEVSCNYFFYDLGAGYDYAAGHSLGLNDMNISKVMDYAEKLGLGQKTGIELAESAAGVPSEEKKTESIKNSLKYMLRLNASKYFEADIVNDKDRLNETLDTIVSWADENPKRSELYNRLSDIGVLKDQLNTLTDTIRSDYFSVAKWGAGDSFNLSIGQGENAYTPVQMARYVAALANDGVVHNLTLTKSVEGMEIEEDEGYTVENSNSEAYQIVREGMHLVAQGSSGSGRGVFGSFPYSVAAKTGSAQKSGKVNPPDEVEYIKQHLSSIAPGLSFEDVETEMKRLLTEESDIYKSESTAVRRAVINLAGVSTDKIDAYKSSYDAFAWFVAYAPIEDPQIAVAVLIYQGGSGGYAGPVAREIIGKYMELQEVYSDYTDGETSFVS
jgi:penicillin-binding protein 2